jgi:pimeloyl-ACP methyl ester carboxylesterase
MSAYNQTEVLSHCQVNSMNQAVAAEKATRKFTTIAGYTITYIAEGNPANPALLLVHGLLAHAGFWRDVIDRFKDTHYCVAIDLAGFGFSDKPANGDYTIPAQANRVLALADHLGIQQFSLAGHSMGGQIVLYLAIHAPQRVQKVVTLGGVVTGALAAYFKNLYRLPLWMGYYAPQVWLMSRIGLRYILPYKWMFTDFAMTYHRNVIPMGSVDIEMGIIEGIERPAYLAFQALQQCDLTPDLGRIKAPVLILHGEQDNTVPAASGRHAHQHIAGSQLVIFNPCGHTPNLEVPDEFFPAITAFLTNGAALR